MNNAITWRADEPSSPKGAQASILLREATLENRLNALREVALNLLSEVESLRSAQPTRGDQNLRLYDEVKRFEIDLIRFALERTGGSQTRAARLLGVKHTTLNAKIKRYKISFISHEAQAGKDAHNREIAA